MGRLVLKSPAKLNLFLNVLRKRTDGYHNIETIFEKIALFDIITIRAQKKGIKITTDANNLPTDKRNLVYKAVRAIFNKTKFKGGIWVNIEKNIPIAAGLGGGSSNAAMTLLGVNKFFKLGLKKIELIDLASTLGADVPFFLYDCRFAIGKGKGDEIIPLNSNIILWHNIISFDFGLSTKVVYNNLNLGLTPNLIDVKILLRFIRKNDVESLSACLYNKLEEVVLNRVRVVGTVKKVLLKEGSYAALLSGSGPTVFGITKTREEAIWVKKRVQKRLEKGCKTFVVSTFNA